MTRQHARHHSKTTVRRKQAVRSHKASSNRHRRMPVEGKGQNPDTFLPNAIEFLEIDVVGPFDAGLEAEEYELVAADIEEV